MKYQVIGLVDAVIYSEVEADSPEEAVEGAELHVSLCHQCAREVEVGGVHAVRVCDEDGEEVYTDESANLYLASTEELRAEIARREAGESDGEESER